MKIKKEIRVKYKGFDCLVKVRRYIANNKTAICLEEFRTGDPIATATANLVFHPLKSDEVHIKEYSEKGITDILVKAGVIEEPIDVITIGDFNSPVNVCKLLIN